MSHISPKTAADLESFVDLLKATCHDPKTNATLEKLLSMPDDK